jgi:O-antigen/teichoic acid export membrane protein
VTAPAVCGLFVGLAPEICRFMFGATVRTEATAVMPWIAAAVTLGSLRAFFFDIAFHVEKNSALQLKLMLAMAAVNVALNLLLIPKMGVQGAAIATTVALALGTAASAWLGRRAAIYPPVLADISKAFFLTLAFALALRWTADWQHLFLGNVWRGLACTLLFMLLAWGLDLAQTRALCAAAWGHFIRKR